MTELLAAGTRRTDDTAATLERHRRELIGYCYRMLGSAFEAEDAVQETMMRAWRGMDGFEGRASLRSWLFRIATNVCLDMAQAGRRRARPVDMDTLSRPLVENLGPALPEHTWVLPIPDARVVPADGDPAELAEARESVRLAFIAALQHLPPRQRAVLVLRDVLRWQAAEVADLLDSTVASVTSALQRARATIDGLEITASDAYEPMDAEQQDLLARYLDAFERYDLDLLTSLLHEEATQSMPPYAMWLRGPEDIRTWFEGPGAGCRGSRLVLTAANGQAAFGQYRAAEDGGHEPWALHLLEFRDGRIAGDIAFLDTPALFPLFGLPARLDA